MTQSVMRLSSYKNGFNGYIMIYCVIFLVRDVCKYKGLMKRQKGKVLCDTNAGAGLISAGWTQYEYFLEGLYDAT